MSDTAHKKKHLFIVFANPIAGMEAEFNRWYDEQHLQDLLTLPEFIAAQRFSLDPVQYHDCARSQRYAVIYEIETANLPAALDSLKDALEKGEIAKSAAFDWDTMWAPVYTPISERLVKN